MISVEFALFTDGNDICLQYYVFCVRRKTSYSEEYEYRTLNLRHNVYGPALLACENEHEFEYIYHLQSVWRRKVGPAKIYTYPYTRKAILFTADNQSQLFDYVIIGVTAKLKLTWYKDGKKTKTWKVTPAIMRDVCDTVDILTYIQPRLTQLKYVHRSTVQF
jgi:hypothetical protein